MSEAAKAHGSTAWTARWSSRTGLRLIWPSCARFLRSSPISAKPIAHRLCEPAPVFRSSGSGHAERTRNGAAASSSSAITARCAIARGLLEEHRFLAHLLAHGASVPRVLASAAGETAIETGEWTYEVHEIPPGIDLYQDAISWTPFRSAAHAHSAGRRSRSLHLAAQRFRCSAAQAAPARRQLHHLRRRRS